MRLGLSFSVPNSKTIALEELSKPEIDAPTSEKTTIELTKDTEKTIVNEVERECVAVMRANGGAPHYM